MIRPTERADAAAILDLLRASGQFNAEGLTFVQDTLEQHLREPGPAVWLTADDGEPVGVAYCAPEAVASGTWNLLMLWTRNDRKGQGLGRQLLNRLELELQSRAARLLIFETSSLPTYAGARSFYARCGFCQEATIRNFYAAEDHKLVFTKPLPIPAAPSAEATMAPRP